MLNRLYQFSKGIKTTILAFVSKTQDDVSDFLVLVKNNKPSSASLTEQIQHIQSGFKQTINIPTFHKELAKKENSKRPWQRRPTWPATQSASHWLSVFRI